MQIDLIGLGRSRWVGLALVPPFLVLAWLFVPEFLHDPQPTAQINGWNFTIGVAASPEARERGLSGRAALAPDAGLLFIHETAGKHCYWMKDMGFAIDILWFDTTRKLIHVERNVQPASYPNSYCPPEDAQYVLEVAAEHAADAGAKLGDELFLSNL